MSVTAAPNTYNAPTGQFRPPAEAATTILEAPGERYLAVLDIPETGSTETTGDYASVNLSVRRPLLSAAEVNEQIPGGGDMLGELMAQIDEPAPDHIGLDSQTRRTAAYANRVYVFRREGYNGPEYTILGTAALGRIADGRPNPEGAIMHMAQGDAPLVIGSAQGNWLPSVGYDRSQLAQNEDLARASRTVSRTQGRFLVDEHGNLHYQEIASRKNPAIVAMHKTQSEQDRDQDRARERADIIQRARTEHRDNRKTLVQGRLYGASRHDPLSEGQLAAEDLVRKMPTRTFGGHIVAETYRGTHRRAGFLGRLAAKVFGR